MSIDRRFPSSFLVLACVLSIVGCNGGGSATRMSLVLEDSGFAHARAATFDLATGAVALAASDLPDSDSVPVRFGDTSGILFRTNGQLAILGADGLSVTRTIDLNEPGMTGGHASNPQSVVSVSATKAYVPRLAVNSLLVIDPTKSGTDARLRTIDLSGFQLPADMDGVVDAGPAIVVGSRAFVALGRYYYDTVAMGTAYPGTSVIVVIDTATDTLVDTDSVMPGIQGVSLEQHGPVALASQSGKLLVGSNGVLGVNDGGIEVVDLGTFSTRTIIGEATLGGDLGLGGIAVIGDTLVAQVTFLDSHMMPDAKVVAVDQTAGTVGRTILGTGALTSAFSTAMAPAGSNDLAIGTSAGGSHRLAIYDVTTATDVTPPAAPSAFDMMFMLAGLATAD